MNQSRLLRSALYTPGSNESVLVKASRSDADVLIFDLEDAVAPELKVEARRTVERVVTHAALAGRNIVVRVNGANTAWFEDDVRSMAALPLTAILFPKINSEQDIKVAQAMMGFYGAPRSTELWCMIETPVAFLNARTLGEMAHRPGSRMTTWVLGTNDLVKELKAQHTVAREGILPMLSLALLGARAFGISILDGVHNSLKDEDGLTRVCVQGRQMGFDGKTLIHPSQVDTCNRVYSPSEQEVLEARAIVDAFALAENQDKGAIQIRGRMIELLHAEMARETIAVAEAIIRSRESRASLLETNSGQGLSL